MEGTPTQISACFPAEQGADAGEAGLTFQGCESRALAPRDLLGSPLISLYLALKWITGKTVLFCPGPEVLRVTVRNFNDG